jgi:hypothetical protein
MGRDSKLTAVKPPMKVDESVAPASRMDASELAYQQALIQKIQDEQKQHQALMRTWTEFLGRKYQLGEKDRITDDGRFVRVTDDTKESV